MIRWKHALAFPAMAGVLALSALAGAQEPTKLLRQPGISATSIVFVYGGDLWTVPRTGGTARRLTANPSIKRYPKYSPDGKWIAFTGNYDGNSDVYIIPAEGGEPKRLTWHPFPDEVVGWTPDGKAVLFRSLRTSFHSRAPKFFTVPVTGGLETELPLPEAIGGSFSPDSTKIAYNRIDKEGSPWKWKRYRGGAQSYVSIYDLAAKKYSEIPHEAATDLNPMWIGSKIYFASDRMGTANIFSYDTNSKKIAQLTKYTDYDVKWPSMGPDAIVYEQGGVLNVFDIKTSKATPINIQANSDLPATRPGLRRVENLIQGFGLSPTGTRALFDARGDVFSVPAKKGETRDLTNTPGVREINATWSPDGKYIAYLSDKSGEYELYFRPQDGSGDETRITTDGHVYRFGPVWSPDSKTLLYTDATSRLWTVSIADKKPVEIDRDEFQQLQPGIFSPDSKWIVYTKAAKNNNGRIVLYSVDRKKVTVVSDGRYNDTSPAFDTTGKYLFFLSDRNFTPTQYAPETNINFENVTGIYALALSKDTANPLAPESDEEKPKEDPPAPKADAPKPDAAKPDAPKPAAPAASKPETKIELDGLYDRIIALPVPPGNYAQLTAGANKAFYLSVAIAQGAGTGTLIQFDLTSRTAAPIIAGIGGYDINPAGTKILYGAPGSTFGIIDAAPGQAVGAGRLNLALEMRVDPRAEWKEIFTDAWRFERDFFYDPNMRGMDWKGIGDRYAKLIPYVAHRDDLTYILEELQGELSTSHAFVNGLPTAGAPQVNVGLLGVDYEADQGYYRFKRIYEGENWDPTARSPLREPGVNVKEGEYLIAVNGNPVKTDMNPYAAFEGLAGKTVVLKINSKPSPDGAREVKVRPIGQELNLRYTAWVEGNRKRVEQATGGRVAYIHVPSTADSGITGFGRGFYSQTDKDAVIVDERYNDGGYIPDFFVEKLARQLLTVVSARIGGDQKFPPAGIYGPKVMLANEWAGSGGDAFPAFFREANLGPIIGKRTAGGLVGINGGKALMDGGGIATPSFGLWSPKDGKWIAENHGIDPDIEVSNTPDRTVLGEDPQLQKAIEVIMDQLKKNPPKPLKRPAYPIDPYIGKKSG
jgi:tricorn protease